MYQRVSSCSRFWALLATTGNNNFWQQRIGTTAHRKQKSSYLMHFFDVGGFGGKVEGFYLHSDSESGILVPEEGVEPTRPCGHRILSPARLPVPPFGHIGRIASPESSFNALSNRNHFSVLS